MAREDFVNQAIGSSERKDQSKADQNNPYVDANKGEGFNEELMITDIQTYVDSQVDGLTNPEKLLALPAIATNVGICVGNLYSSKSDSRQRVDGNAVQGNLATYCKGLLNALPEPS